MRKIVKVYEHKQVTINNETLDILKVVDITYASITDHETAITEELNISLKAINNYHDEPYLFDTDIMCYGIDTRELFISDLKEYFIGNYYIIKNIDGIVKLEKTTDPEIIKGYLDNAELAYRKALKLDK